MIIITATTAFTGPERASVINQKPLSGRIAAAAQFQFKVRQVSHARGRLPAGSLVLPLVILFTYKYSIFILLFLLFLYYHDQGRVRSRRHPGDGNSVTAILNFHHLYER